MPMLLTIIGAGCIGAGFFGKEQLGEKHLHVFIAGLFLLGGGLGLR